MDRYQITLVIETDEDPSTVFDLAIEAAERLAEDTEGKTDPDSVSVQWVKENSASLSMGCDLPGGY